MEFVYFIIIVVFWQIWVYPILYFFSLFLPESKQPGERHKAQVKKHKKYTDNTPDPFVDLNQSTEWVANQFMSAESKARYLSSPTWGINKILVKNRDNFQCKVCGSTSRLEVHHISYERLGDEELSDLVLLCGGPNGCHNKLHKLLGYDRTTTFDISTLRKP